MAPHPGYGCRHNIGSYDLESALVSRPRDTPEGTWAILSSRRKLEGVRKYLSKADPQITLDQRTGRHELGAERTQNDPRLGPDRGRGRLWRGNGVETP